MKCPACGTENADDAAFCGECGYNFSPENIMNTLDENVSDNAENEKNKYSKHSKKSPKPRRSKKKDAVSDAADESGGGKNRQKRLRVKIILIAIVIIAAVVGIIILLSMFSSTEGEKVLKNVPIGRNVEYAESKIDREFTKVSRYDAVNALGEFDFICEPDSGLRVEGAHFPEWAVTVSLAADETIEQVYYYDFSALQKNWKGHHMNAEIPLTSIEYGMSEKAAERKMGFKPYMIIKDIDNTATYIYRYYYSDDITGNDVVCNYYVVFNDADGSVKDVYSENLDYCGFMLGVN
jgi:hypothetical protein